MKTLTGKEVRFVEKKDLPTFATIKTAIEAEGLDRAIGGPSSIQPSEKDLELVA